MVHFGGRGPSGPNGWGGEGLLNGQQPLYMLAYTLLVASSRVFPFIQQHFWLSGSLCFKEAN